MSLLMQDNYQEINLKFNSYLRRLCKLQFTVQWIHPFRNIAVKFTQQRETQPIPKRSRKKICISLFFGSLMNCLAWALVTILTRSALAACVGCSPAVYFFQPAVSKTSVGFGQRLTVPRRISTGPPSHGPNQTHTSIIEEHSTMVNLSSLISCSFCRDCGEKTAKKIIFDPPSQQWEATWLWHKNSCEFKRIQWITMHIN